MWFKLAGADFSKNNLGTMSSISSSYLIDYTGLTGMSGSPSSVSYAGSSAGTSKTASVVVTVTSGYTFKRGSKITASGGKSGTVFTADKDYTGGQTFTFSMAITANTKLTGVAEATGGSSSGGNTGGSGEKPKPDTPVNPPSGDTTTLTLHKSATGNSILDYQDVWKMFGAGALATLGSQIIGVDISAYAGQTMTITAAQSVIDGANYAMICSNLPNAYIKSLAELDGYNSFGTPSEYIAENYNNLIESFNISTVNETTNTITKTIPSGAKYLFFGNLTTKCANPSVVINGNSSSGGNTTTPLTFYKTANDVGMSIFYYQDALRTNSNTTFIGLGSEIIGVDVSSYVGKTLKITSTQSVVSGAQYGVFMSAPLLSTITPDKLPTFTTVNANVPTDNVINYIQISDTDQTTNTKNIVVPTGAKYLYFSNLRKKQTSEPAIIVEV